jgi:thiol-disulfide isomerase/thioredoxin
MQRSVFILFLLLFPLSGSTVFGATAMPEFSLPSATDNKKVSSSEFKGKVLLVTFFATWCPPCRQEIPTFIELQKKWSSMGFTVLGMSVDEGGPEVVNMLIEMEEINYPVLMADDAALNGFGKVSGIPTSFLVNSKGNVVKSYSGYITHEQLEEDIEHVLQGN